VINGLVFDHSAKHIHQLIQEYQMLNRILFVGADIIGVNAVFEVKRRLCITDGPNQNPLVKKEELDHNPFQFLVIHEGKNSDGQGAPLSNQFKYKRTSGLNDDLFQIEHEIVNKNGGSSNILKAFKASIQRLLAFNPQIYHSVSGIQTSVYTPAVLLVLDIETWKNNSWKQALMPLFHPDDPSLYDGTGNLRYHLHCLFFCPRHQNNCDIVRDLLDKVHSIFFFDNEGPFPLEMPDDAIEQAANFLNVAALLDNARFMNLFDSAKRQKCFSFGSSRLYYPKDKMVNDAAMLILGNPDFGHKKGLGEWFYDCFLGNFEKIADEGPDTTFTIGDEDSQIADGVSDEYRPIIRHSSINRANQLFFDAEKWLEDHTKSIKKHLQKESLFSRISELTNPNTFFKIFVEKWYDSLDFLDFIIKSEVLMQAKLNSERVKEEFLKRWSNKTEDLYNKAREVVSADGKLLSEHTGETTWELSRQIITHVRDNLIERYRIRNTDTEYQPSEAPKRDDVDAEIKKLPRPASLLTRLAIFTAIMVFGWPDFHHLLAKWKFDYLLEIPSWITGFPIGLLLVVIFAWLAYGRKVKDLREILGIYLQDRRNIWKYEIKKTEEELIIGFLTDCLRHIKLNFTTRKGFFYQVIENRKYNFEEIHAENFIGFSTFPNTLEIHYLNRFYIYNLIQKMLADMLQNYDYILSVPIPDPIEEDYGHIIRGKAMQVKDCKKIVSSPNISAILKNNLLWTEILFRDNEILSIIPEKEKGGKKVSTSLATKICKGIIRQLCFNIGELFEDDPKYKNLFTYLSSIRYKMPLSTNRLLSDRSDTTFQLQTSPTPELTIFSGSKNYFHPSLQIEELLDQNCIIFLKIEGPHKFDNIPWREEDVSA